MATYYVGPGGNDANNGTSWALRKLTLNGAEDIPVAAGDTVYVGPGTYRETLTVDVSGSAGSPITYIGDYTGANTDGVGGVVRITGSDNDQTATRATCITDNSAQRNYRTFAGFAFDLPSSQAILANAGGTNWIVDQCYFQNALYAVSCNGASQASWTVQRCYVVAPNNNSAYGFVFNHSALVDNAGHLVQNCVGIGGLSAASFGVRSIRVGGIIVKNSFFMGWGAGVDVAIALTAGQTVGVYNSIFVNNINSVKSVAVGWLVENYNALWQSARSNVDTGANSNTYPPLFDTRWFFEAVNGGDMVTPFDLASYSQLVNVAGTSPATTDMRGASVIGAQREWGALEYDPALLIEAGAGGGAVSISPYRGNF